MASCLRYICCVCAKTDDKTYFTLTENGSIGKTSYKQRNKRNSKQKGTWTRRSLLANDDEEMEEMAYQMKVITRNKELDASPFNTHQPSNQRRTAQDVFAGVQRNPSQTTIPHWMDENFVPNSRTATRLGISSVQINAKRNEIANRRSQDLTTQSYRNNSFSPGNEHDKKNGAVNEPLKSVKPQVGNHVIPSNNGFHDNTIPRANVNVVRHHVIPAKTSTIPRPVSSSAVIDKPLIFRESQSDVGVRRIVPNTPGYRRGNPIPRLEDYTGGNQSVDVTDGHSSRSNVETRPPYRHSGYAYYTDYQEADLTYSSNIIFKKSDVSLKRDNEPAAFSSTGYTDRQQKQKVPLKTRSNPTPKHKPNYAKTAESMYGYIPKIVRNVHASNALEGNQIDDFFMQRMHDRELEKFASIGKDNGEKEETETMIVTSLVREQHTSAPTHKVRQTIPENNALLGIGHTHEKVPTSELFNQNTMPVPPVKQRTPPASVEGAKTLSVHTSEPSKTEDQVIMIDFPPNLEKDQPKPVMSPLKIIIDGQEGLIDNSHISNKEQDPASGVKLNTDTHENETQTQQEPLSSTKAGTDRPRITMGLARTRGAHRADSDVSRRSTQTTTSSILESAEVLY